MRNVHMQLGGRGFLHAVFKRGNKELIDTVMPLLQGDDLLVPSKRTQETPLHDIAENTMFTPAEFDRLFSLPSVRCAHFVLVLLHQNLNPQRAGDNYTPLHCACQSGNLEAVRALIRTKRVDPGLKASKNMAPIHVACLGGRAAIAKLLVDEGVDTSQAADPLDADEPPRTPIDFAREAGNLQLVRFLMNPAHRFVSTRYFILLFPVLWRVFSVT